MDDIGLKWIKLVVLLVMKKLGNQIKREFLSLPGLKSPTDDDDDYEREKPESYIKLN
jgi:hypothetical protein